MLFEHKCRTCSLEWLEEYGLHDDPPTHCPECSSEDVYRCVTTSAAIHFKGPGWSPDGYNKYKAYDAYKDTGLKVYDRKEDFEREMRGEAEQAEKAKLKRLHESAKRHLGPDAGLAEHEAEKRIKKAGEESIK